VYISSQNYTASVNARVLQLANQGVELLPAGVRFCYF
jgi:hypothetical protein